MTNNNYHSHLQSSSHFDHSNHQTASTSCCHHTGFRLFFVVILLLLSISTTTALILLLYTDAMKEQALAERKKGWMSKWNVIRPFLKKFPLGFLLGFIRNLIVLAIDRQADLT